MAFEKYFSHPSYYKIDGKPSFIIYELNTLIQGLGGVKETKDALEWFRKETVKEGFKGLDLQLTLRGSGTNVTGIAGDNMGSQSDVIKELGFDCVSHYQFVHYTNIDRDYNEIMEDVEKEWNKLDQEYDIPYYAHISVGWDNNPRFEMFRKGVVKNNTDTHPHQLPLIMINSWNEWTGTSYLMPCTLYGYGYLEAVKKNFVNEK